MVLPGTAWFIKKNRIYSCRVTVQKVCAHTALTVRKHRFSRHRSICITNLFVLQFLHGFVLVMMKRIVSSELCMLLSQNRAYIDIPKLGEIKKMKIIEYFTSEKKEHWLDEIKKCDWEAGQYLHQLLSENSLKRMVGKLLLYQCLWMGIS